MSRTDEELLQDALTHFQTLLGHAVDGVDDVLVIDAICMRMAAGIETLARLDAAERQSLFGQDWPVMWGMRNRIVHGYLKIEPAVIKQTVSEDVPAIVDVISKELHP